VADVAVIIPAYNEAPRVGAVVRAALAAKEVRRVVVVDDGSSDGTAEAAMGAGAEVLVKRNGGKASAMDAGVRAVQNNGICFWDADLVGTRPEHFDALIGPYLRGIKMTVGLIDKHQKVLWSIFAGPRVLPRTAWLWATMAEPDLVRSGYGVEVILAGLANRYGWTVTEVDLPGIEFMNQQQKWGGEERKGDLLWQIARVGRSMKMWGRVAKAASQVGGKRALEDVWKPMIFRRGWNHSRPG
jgi:glycosyltransferase involved in cell wall biosynthesis